MNKIQIAVLAALLLVTLANSCGTCNASKKLDAIANELAMLNSRTDSARAAGMRHTELMFELSQPQIVNQLLMLFNSEKYGNEIKLNQAKIDALKQQIKNAELQNDKQK